MRTILFLLLILAVTSAVPSLAQSANLLPAASAKPNHRDALELVRIHLEQVKVNTYSSKVYRNSYPDKTTKNFVQAIIVYTPKVNRKSNTKLFQPQR